MAELQPIRSLLLPIVISLFWGSFTFITMLWKIIRLGPSVFFHKKKRDKRPACLDDPSLGEHHFIRLKNVRLHYVAAGQSDAPLMLFLHGFPEFWYSWRHQIRAFKDSYRTVAVDMRGYGESDKPKGVSNYALENLAGDIKELIEALGYSQCVLVAHDWGGVLATGLAELHPELVSRLVLCNIPHFKAFEKLIHSSFGQFLKSWYMFMFQIPYLPETLISSNDFALVNEVFTKVTEGAQQASCNEEDVEAYKYSLQQPGGLTAPINYYRASIRYRTAKFPKNKCKVPTLLLWGTQDMALSKEMAEMSREFIEDIDIKYVETSGHWVQMEEPDWVNANIKEYLDKRA